MLGRRTVKIVQLAEKIVRVLLWMCLAFWGSVALYAGVRIFVTDWFVAPSESMTPTIMVGDEILVNKLIFGGRIYTNYNFDEGQPLKSWRMPGIRQIRPNDVLVFNYPRGYDRNKIEFKINYVYCKRCIGTPGDSITVIDGHYRNSNFPNALGIEYKQEELRLCPDSLVAVFNVAPADKSYNWNAKNLGPLYTPKAGAARHLTPYNYKPYKLVIEYETGETLTASNGILMLGDEPLEEYTFKQNYYFVGGDNAVNSLDSRHWGFVPEEFIIGVTDRIVYSVDRSTGRLRRNRIWKRIE